MKEICVGVDVGGTSVKDLNVVFKNKDKDGIFYYGWSVDSQVGD